MEIEKSGINHSMAEMSLYISKASFDKKTQEMRWFAVASDTDRDDYDEKMSIELYNDFIRRAVEEEAPPEELCTDAWCGGMPYLSLSHYPDLNGRGLVGPTQGLYVDGKMLKAKGVFSDTKLGRACFKSICDDLYSEEKSETEKVRISIGFIDWAHYHGNFKFERKNLTDRCPMCAQGVGDRTFARGHLLHLALTRIPVNTRTDILPIVEDSMTTRKEDAESIVGEELAEELEHEAKLVGKSEAVVERTDDDEELVEVEVSEPEVEEVSVEGENIETPEEEVAELEVASLPVEDVAPEETEIQALSREVRELIGIIKPPEKEPHLFDTVFGELRAQYDEVMEMDLSPDEKLQLLQDPFTELGNVLRSGVSATPARETQEVVPDVVTKAELEASLNPLIEQVSLLVAQLEGGASANTIRTATSQRRSVSPLALKRAAPIEEKPNSFASVARRSVGITGY
jgi:hypothetical protein